MVGLSSKPGRPSYEVASYLQEHGYRIVPVNPNEDGGAGRTARSRPCPTSRRRSAIDVVVVFRRAEHAPEVARQAVARGARVLWLQEGIVSDEAAGVATAGGLDVIMGVCIKHVRERLMEEGTA